MKLFNKKHNRPEILISWKFINDNEIYTQYGNSSGLASLETDPLVEIISVEKA